MFNSTILKIFLILSALILVIMLPLRELKYIDGAEIELALIFLVLANSIINYILELKTSNAKKKFINIKFILTIILVSFGVILFKEYNFGFFWTLVLIIRDNKKIYDVLDEFAFLEPIVYRLMPLALLLPSIIHLLACIWISLGSGTAGPDSNKYNEYVKAVYWTMTTLTTVGYGDISAKVPEQMMFTCLVQVLGVAVFGFILSNVASLLARSDAARENHIKQLDEIQIFMKHHKVSEEIKIRVKEYYRYMWKQKAGYQDQSLIKDLPKKLQSEIYTNINKSILTKIPLLKSVSNEVIEDIMLSLKNRICLPGEKIFKQGDSPDGLYLIHRGSVQIFGSRSKLIAELEDGAFFGEMALMLDKPRSATVISKSFGDLYFLSKEDFHRVIDTHPEILLQINEIIKDRNTT